MNIHHTMHVFTKNKMFIETNKMVEHFISIKYVKNGKKKFIQNCTSPVSILCCISSKFD